MVFQVLETILNKKRLLLWTRGNFASGDVYIWHAFRAYALSSSFMSAKIQQIFDSISIRLQWSFEKKNSF